MTFAETDPLTADSYQGSGNDAGHQAANLSPVAETWSRSKRGVVVGVVVAFGMLLMLGFAVLNTSPSSELLDMSLLEDSSSLSSSSSSSFVNFHTCPGATRTVLVQNNAKIQFVFGPGVYEISILDFPDGPSRSTDLVSLYHSPRGTGRPKSVSRVETFGDGFHPSIYLQVDDVSDIVHATSHNRRASLEISLLCHRDYGKTFPPGAFPLRANTLQFMRTFPFDNKETVGIMNDVQPGTRVTASLGVNLRDRHVRVQTFVLDSPMMGIGMRDDKNLRDSWGRILPYAWESSVDITVNTYVADH